MKYLQSLIASIAGDLKTWFLSTRNYIQLLILWSLGCYVLAFLLYMWIAPAAGWLLDYVTWIMFALVPDVLFLLFVCAVAMGDEDDKETAKMIYKSKEE